jgi:restriction system protein
MVNFDSLLAQFKFVAGADVLAGLDSRPDLLAMSPFESETFARQMFEAMGMKAWKTQDIKDDGGDAVAVNEAPVFGGLCVIQAKRTRGAVGIDVVRALAGTMEDKRATKSIVITTSWVTKDGHDFATRCASTAPREDFSAQERVRSVGRTPPERLLDAARCI